jgi:hypothetical protein
MSVKKPVLQKRKPPLPEVNPTGARFFMVAVGQAFCVLRPMILRIK